MFEEIKTNLFLLRILHSTYEGLQNLNEGRVIKFLRDLSSIEYRLESRNQVSNLSGCLDAHFLALVLANVRLWDL